MASQCTVTNLMVWLARHCSDRPCSVMVNHFIIGKCLTHCYIALGFSADAHSIPPVLFTCSCWHFTLYCSACCNITLLHRCKWMLTVQPTAKVTLSREWRGLHARASSNLSASDFAWRTSRECFTRVWELSESPGTRTRVASANWVLISVSIWSHRVYLVDWRRALLTQP